MSHPLLYPRLQGFQQIVFGIDNWPITGAVSERIWTGAPITMGHSRRHEDAVKIMNVSHSLRDFFIVVEAILGCDRGVREFIVAVAGWRLLNEGSHKYIEAPAGEVSQTEILNLAFYPLTLPLTTGPGTIAVVVSLGLSKGSSTDLVDEIIFVIACLLAVSVIALTIFYCFKYAERIQRLLGRGGTDIAVRLFAFILFCLGVQILWSGGSELLRSVIHAGPQLLLPPY
jgi:hypothetical protein